MAEKFYVLIDWQVRIHGGVKPYAVIGHRGFCMGGIYYDVRKYPYLMQTKTLP